MIKRVASRRMRRAVLAVAVAVVAAAVTPALAHATCGSYHCYGEASWDTSGNYTGLQGDVYVSELYPYDLQNDFATAEIWVANNGPNNSDPSGALHVIENGIGNGFRQQDPQRGFGWFWAETSGSSYAEHYNNNWAASYNTTFNSKVSYAPGAAKWVVYQNNVQIGLSGLPQGTVVHHGEAGTENTSPSNIVQGSVKQLQKRGSDNSTWSSNWGGSTTHSDAPAWASWITQDYSLNFYENP